MNRDEKTDVIVIGGGFAGLAAAIEAAEAGAGVIVLEKMKTCGGNSSISDGALAVAGSEKQRELKIKDSPELMAEDILAAGRGLNRPDLVELIARESNPTFEWTRDHLGVEYMDRLDRFGGHSVARCFTPYNHSGSAIVRRQLARLKELGVEIRTRSFLDRLIRGDDGRVRGVEYRSGYAFVNPGAGEPRSLLAGLAVVLASGGFGADVPFRSAQVPSLNEKVLHTNHRGATAEGLIEALRLGAVPIHLSRIQLGPWGCPDERGYGRADSFAAYAVFPFGIVVNPATGERFVDEHDDRKVRADAILAQGQACIGVVDAEGAAKSQGNLKTCLKKGSVKAFDSLDDLARAFDLPREGFLETVQEFNHCVAQGVDQRFGKEFPEGSIPIGKPPFYAIRLWPKVHFCMGGLGVNTRAQALDMEGRSIPGLFAAGEVTGGVHGASRLGSCSITDCLVMGRIAGINAAQEAA